jgi:hypothetical protein
MTNLTIEGERYRGIFDATLKTGEAGGKEYSSPYDVYWYSGTGVIRDKKEKKQYVFSLVTKSFEERYSPQDFFKENCTLEESIVHFNQKNTYRYFIPEIIPGKYEHVVDMSLEKIIAQIRKSKEKIPAIEPERLGAEDLIEKGFCFDETGQIHLPFKGN